MIKDFLNTILRFLYEHHIVTPLLVSRIRYILKLKRIPNIKNPKDLNEKILHLAFYTDTTEWTRLSDKFEVREFVKERGCEYTLTQLYASYTSADDIDFDSLPNNFVMKCNNGYGDVVIVNDKSAINYDELRTKARKWLSTKFGYLSAEPHYLNIKPRIIFEELLKNDNPESTSIVDYKFWCFNGKAIAIFVCSNRNINKHSSNYDYYTLEWISHPEYMTPNYRSNLTLNKPDCLDEMIKISERLSKGFPIVRVDLYSSGGKPYFGEMTFTSNAGRMPFYTKETLLMLGKMAEI